MINIYMNIFKAIAEIWKLQKKCMATSFSDKPKEKKVI